jgi:hypothetical protein
MINSKQTINEYSTQSLDRDFAHEFPTLWLYCLYLCGGDFSQFDDLPELQSHFEEPEESEPEPNAEPS